MNCTPAAARPLSARLPFRFWRWSLHALLVGAAWLLTADPAAAAPLDIRVVDTAGHPVPGVTIEFVDRPIGAFGEANVPVRRSSDEAGAISTSDLAQPPVRFRVANDPAAGDDAADHWVLRFVHGRRIEESAATPDLLGYKPKVFDLEQDVICVVEEAGTIEIRVAGASKDDSFHATFVDARPEPESHRNVSASGSFRGATGSIRVPAGRGTLYLAQEGFLGAPILAHEGPLMVSVTPQQTTRVTVRFLEGPTARLLAPFDSIPFAKMQALAPDGETVVAVFPFDTSPLNVPSRLAVTAGHPGSPSELPALRLPKHLVRAVDVPLQLPAVEDPNAKDAAKRYLERPPMELIFAIDPGGKMRLPEVAGGWVREAEGGMLLLTRAFYDPRTGTGITRPTLGTLHMGGEGSGAPWSARVVVKDAAGVPQPFVEAFVARPRAMLARGITGPDGALNITGLESDSVAVALADSVAEGLDLTRPAEAGARLEGVITTGARIAVRGTWTRSPDDFGVGELLALVPSDAEDRAGRARFMTHATSIAFVDAAGKFDFGSVPVGRYTLRAGSSSEAPVDLQPQAAEQPRAAATLKLTGTGEAFKAAKL